MTESSSWQDIGTFCNETFNEDNFSNKDNFYSTKTPLLACQSSSESFVPEKIYKSTASLTLSRSDSQRSRSIVSVRPLRSSASFSIKKRASDKTIDSKDNLIKLNQSCDDLFSNFNVSEFKYKEDGNNYSSNVSREEDSSFSNPNVSFAESKAKVFQKKGQKKSKFNKKQKSAESQSDYFEKNNQSIKRSRKKTSNANYFEENIVNINVSDIKSTKTVPQQKQALRRKRFPNNESSNKINITEEEVKSLNTSIDPTYSHYLGGPLLPPIEKINKPGTLLERRSKISSSKSQSFSYSDTPKTFKVVSSTTSLVTLRKKAKKVKKAESCTQTSFEYDDSEIDKGDLSADENKLFSHSRVKFKPSLQFNSNINKVEQFSGYEGRVNRSNSKCSEPDTPSSEKKIKFATPHIYDSFINKIQTTRKHIQNFYEINEDGDTKLDFKSSLNRLIMNNLGTKGIKLKKFAEAKEKSIKSSLLNLSKAFGSTPIINHTKYEHFGKYDTKSLRSEKGSFKKIKIDKTKAKQKSSKDLKNLSQISQKEFSLENSNRRRRSRSLFKTSTCTQTSFSDYELNEDAPSNEKANLNRPNVNEHIYINIPEALAYLNISTPHLIESNKFCEQIINPYTNCVPRNAASSPNLTIPTIEYTTNNISKTSPISKRRSSSLRSKNREAYVYYRKKTSDDDTNSTDDQCSRSLKPTVYANQTSRKTLFHIEPQKTFQFSININQGKSREKNSEFSDTDSTDEKFKPFVHCQDLEVSTNILKAHSETCNNESMVRSSDEFKSNVNENYSDNNDTNLNGKNFLATCAKENVYLKTEGGESNDEPILFVKDIEAYNKEFTLKQFSSEENFNAKVSVSDSEISSSDQKKLASFSSESSDDECGLFSKQMTVEIRDITRKNKPKSSVSEEEKNSFCVDESQEIKENYNKFMATKNKSFSLDFRSQDVDNSVEDKDNFNQGEKIQKEAEMQEINKDDGLNQIKKNEHKNQKEIEDDKNTNESFDTLASIFEDNFKISFASKSSTSYSNSTFKDNDTSKNSSINIVQSLNDCNELCENLYRDNSCLIEKTNNDKIVSNSKESKSKNDVKKKNLSSNENNEVIQGSNEKEASIVNSCEQYYEKKRKINKKFLSDEHESLSLESSDNTQNKDELEDLENETKNNQLQDNKINVQNWDDEETNPLLEEENDKKTDSNQNYNLKAPDSNKNENKNEPSTYIESLLNCKRDIKTTQTVPITEFKNCSKENLHFLDEKETENCSKEIFQDETKSHQKTIEEINNTNKNSNDNSESRREKSPLIRQDAFDRYSYEIGNDIPDLSGTNLLDKTQSECSVKEMQEFTKSDNSVVKKAFQTNLNLETSQTDNELTYDLETDKNLRWENIPDDPEFRDEDDCCYYTEDIKPRDFEEKLQTTPLASESGARSKARRQGYKTYHGKRPNGITVKNRNFYSNYNYFNEDYSYYYDNIAYNKGQTWRNFSYDYDQNPNFYYRNQRDLHQNKYNNKRNPMEFKTQPIDDSLSTTKKKKRRRPRPKIRKRKAPNAEALDETTANQQLNFFSKNDEKIKNGKEQGGNIPESFQKEESPDEINLIQCQKEYHNDRILFQEKENSNKKTSSDKNFDLDAKKEARGKYTTKELKGQYD